MYLQGLWSWQMTNDWMKSCLYLPMTEIKASWQNFLGSLYWYSFRAIVSSPSREVLTPPNSVSLLQQQPNLPANRISGHWGASSPFGNLDFADYSPVEKKLFPRWEIFLLLDWATSTCWWVKLWKLAMWLRASVCVSFLWPSFSMWVCVSFRCETSF